MLTTSIESSEDNIDSRDVIARIEELEDDRIQLCDALEELEAADTKNATAVKAAQEALDEWDESCDGLELLALSELAKQCEDVSDWKWGVTLIRDNAFKEYAWELAEDISGIDMNQWPANCIDWDEAVCELQQDYTSVDFEGVTYWVRA